MYLNIIQLNNKNYGNGKQRCANGMGKRRELWWKGNGKWEMKVEIRKENQEWKWVGKQTATEQ